MHAYPILFASIAVQQISPMQMKIGILYVAIKFRKKEKKICDRKFI